MRAGGDQIGPLADKLGRKAGDMYEAGSILSFKPADRPEAFLVKSVGHFPDVTRRCGPRIRRIPVSYMQAQAMRRAGLRPHSLVTGGCTCAQL